MRPCLSRPWSTRGAKGKWAESAVAEGPLASPELALAEASNILRRLEQAGEISRLEANSAQRDLLRLDMDLFSVRAVRRPRMGIAEQPDQLRRLVRGAGRGARLPTGDD